MTSPNDARTLLRQIDKIGADIEPHANRKQLTEKLHGITNECNNAMIPYLGENRNETETLYPGTNLRMVCKLVLN